MAVLPTYFEKFVSNVQPSDERVMAVSNAHTTLRKHLLEDAELTYSVDDSFLSGSYGRRTAIDPIKDADIILVLERTDISGDRKQPRPRAVLEDLRNAIDQFYDDVNLETQRRSIQVELEEDDVRMDVVPAIAPNGKDQTLYVPDYQQNTWIESKPLGHIGYALDKNASSGGQYKRVVKAFKWWRTHALEKERAPKSFLLEVLVGEHLGVADSLPEAFVATAHRIHTTVAASLASGRVPVVCDPGVSSNDLSVSCDWTVSDCQYFADKLSAMLTEAGRAVREATPKADTISLWQSIFGAEKYPSSLSEEEDRSIAEALAERRLDGERALPRLLPVPFIVHVTAAVRPKWSPGAPLESYPNDGPKLPHQYDVRFTAQTNVPYPYTVRWTVQNHGRQARSRGDMRRITPKGPEDPSQREKWEQTGYRGHHHMKCDIVRDGRVLASTRFTVNVR